ncbi:MAG: sulfotransferase, partial [Oscillatoria sp. PMC 1076.18]|nr:sulfotransferase [Oscillatoria sp. PMC 1076.18]
MRNCLILGSGRSGTSMVAATLAKSGYFMGEKISRSRANNPQGNFEDLEVNRINEQLLAQVVPKRPKFIGKWLFLDRPVMWQRWLSRVPVGTQISTSDLINEKISALTNKKPYCFKDPRFSYTLPVWQPFLKDTVFVCIFREPANTAESILTLLQKAPHLKNPGFAISFHQAVEVWTLIYKHILEIHRHQGEWLFLHYNQAVTKQGLAQLETFTGASVDYSIPDLSIRQSYS